MDDHDLRFVLPVVDYWQTADRRAISYYGLRR